jgi:16S rRNA (guanine1207-N2)-methyltransferase
MSGSQYFEPSPGVPSAPRSIRVALPDGELHLQTDRGVFAHDALDTGTRVLLLGAPPPATAGDLLDLGCGTGAIALTLARRSPAATVWAIDVNDRALELCRGNAARNGITNVRVCGPDDVPAAVRFATIWSNPPIRIGKPALHALLTRWLGRLADVGTACLVVQKHLGADSLARWLGEQGWRVSRLSSRAGYRILLVAATDNAIATGTS